MYKQLIIDTCKKYGLLRNEAAYVLATVEWECIFLIPHILHSRQKG